MNKKAAHAPEAEDWEVYWKVRNCQQRQLMWKVYLNVWFSIADPGGHNVKLLHWGGECEGWEL